MRTLFGLLVLAITLSVGYAEKSANEKVANDKRIMDEIRGNNTIMKNLGHLSDVIGPRLTGSTALKKANDWTAEKFKEYGLSNVRLEPYEIPIGWTRGTATLTLEEPVKRELIVASAGWRPGTNGPVTGPVVFFNPRTTKDLEKYKGTLKNAVLIQGDPARVAPVTDTTYGRSRPSTPEPKKEEPKKDEPKKEEPKKDPPKEERRGRGDFGGIPARELTEFLKAEGVACTLRDSAKPHGLLVTTGSWGSSDDRVTLTSGIPSLFIAHEHYALLHRLITEHKLEPKITVSITNTFSDGPVTVYNTVGELPGSEKPDEIVVIGAHLDSWDLASGTTDNGTGSSVVLECARTLGALAKQGIRPKRTIRFCLFSGEEQGLHGSRQYCKRHKPDLDKHSAALVHDTGTGKVTGLTLMSRKSIESVLAPELVSLKDIGFTGLEPGFMSGTDHLPFHSEGVPAFPCKQDTDEYRFTHHTQSDTLDKAKLPNLIQGAQVLSVAAFRIADMPEMLPREKIQQRSFGRPEAPTPEKKETTPPPKKP